jgi:hypothetical protein
VRNLQRSGRKCSDRIDIGDDDRWLSGRYCFSIAVYVMQQRIDVEIVMRKKVVWRPPFAGLIRPHVECWQADLDEIEAGGAQFGTYRPPDGHRACNAMVHKSAHDRQGAHDRAPAGTQKKEHLVFWRRAHRLSFARPLRPCTATQRVGRVRLAVLRHKLIYPVIPGP